MKRGWIRMGIKGMPEVNAVGPRSHRESVLICTPEVFPASLSLLLNHHCWHLLFSKIHVLLSSAPIWLKKVSFFWNPIALIITCTASLVNLFKTGSILCFKYRFFFTSQFIYLFVTFFYCCSSIVVFIFLPPQPSPLLPLDPTPLWFLCSCLSLYLGSTKYVKYSQTYILSIHHHHDFGPNEVK